MIKTKFYKFSCSMLYFMGQQILEYSVLFCISEFCLFLLNLFLNILFQICRVEYADESYGLR